MLFYSQGLPSVFIAVFSFHFVIFVLRFFFFFLIFLHTLNAGKVPSSFALSLLSDSVVVKATTAAAADYCLCYAHLTCGNLFIFFSLPLYHTEPIRKFYVCVCFGRERYRSSGVCITLHPLHNESGIITCLHFVLLFVSRRCITYSTPRTAFSVCDAFGVSRDYEYAHCLYPMKS